LTIVYYLKKLHKLINTKTADIFITHRYEKMISGKYLGEMVRLVCHDLITKKLLCGGKMLPVFEEKERFESYYLAVFEEG